MHQSKNKPNFISRLHSASGFGVRPLSNSATDVSNTRSIYSCDKSTDKNGIRKCAATRMASSLSTPAVHGYPSIAMRIKTPVTSYPCRCKRAADTAESTPPESPTNTRPLVEVFLFVGQMLRIGDSIMEVARFVRKEVYVFCFYGRGGGKNSVNTRVVDGPRRKAFVFVGVIRRVKLQVLEGKLKRIFTHNVRKYGIYLQRHAYFDALPQHTGYYLAVFCLRRLLFEYRRHRQQFVERMAGSGNLFLDFTDLAAEGIFKHTQNRLGRLPRPEEVGVWEHIAIPRAADKLAVIKLRHLLQQYS